MLQRLFSRNVPEDRVSDALEHSKAMEERDALRERSAVILGRLERRQEQARRTEIAARQAASDAHDKAIRDAEAAAAAAAAQAEEAARAAAALGDEDETEAAAPGMRSAVEYDAPAIDETDAAEEMEAAPAAADVEEYEPEQAYAAPEPEQDLHEAEPEQAYAAPEAEEDDVLEAASSADLEPEVDYRPLVEADEDLVEYEPEEDYVPTVEAESLVEAEPVAEATEAEIYEAAPQDEHGAPETAFRPMAEPQHDFDDDEPEEDFALSIDAGDGPETEEDDTSRVEAAAEPDDRDSRSADFFADDRPLYSSDAPAPRHGETDGALSGVEPPAMDYDQDDRRMFADEHHDDEPAQAGPARDDDDDVYEQIRQKAEEARARIARRLEQMKADEQSGHRGYTLGRIELGASAPPLSPRLGDHDD